MPLSGISSECFNTFLSVSCCFCYIYVAQAKIRREMIMNVKMKSISQLKYYLTKVRCCIMTNWKSVCVAFSSLTSLSVGQIEFMKQQTKWAVRRFEVCHFISPHLYFSLHLFVLLCILPPRKVGKNTATIPKKLAGNSSIRHHILLVNDPVNPLDGKERCSDTIGHTCLWIPTHRLRLKRFRLC